MLYNILTCNLEKLRNLGYLTIYKNQKSLASKLMVKEMRYKLKLLP